MRFGTREIIFLIVLLAVPAASGFFVFKPRNDDIRQARTEIEEKQAKLDQLSEISARIDDINLAIDRGREAIEELEAKLPSRQHVEEILEQVWQIARRNQLTVKSVKGQKTVDAANYLELPLRVSMEGSFDGFYQFLLELEELERITRIHQLKMERLQAQGGDEDVSPGSMKTEFTLSIYFEP